MNLQSFYFCEDRFGRGHFCRDRFGRGRFCTDRFDSENPYWRYCSCFRSSPLNSFRRSLRRVTWENMHFVQTKSEHPTHSEMHVCDCAESTDEGAPFAGANSNLLFFFSFFFQIRHILHPPNHGRVFHYSLVYHNVPLLFLFLSLCSF